MLIGIDGNEANEHQRVGVHQYAYEILWSFYRMRRKGETKNNFVVYLKNAPSQELPAEKSYWKYKVLADKGLWIFTTLTYELFKSKRPDVFFTPGHYLPLVSPVPRVNVIHDLGYLSFTEQFKKRDFWQLKLWTASSIYVAKRIIAVSEFTKKDIVRHYKYAKEKTNIAHHGYDKNRYNNKITQTDVRLVENKYKLPSNYILFLSTLKPSKNIEGTISAFAKLPFTKPQFINLKLVIAGKKGWLYESIYQKAVDLGVRDKVIFTDYVDEKDKPAMMKGARVFVCASFWEGFGMQVLEAMAVGTPVVVSKAASLPEVAGNAGIYVNAEDTASITEGIEKVLNMGKIEYNTQIEKCLSQAANFDWTNTARKTISSIESAAGNKSG
jgi:glycosyltransferase involved in cell wall biosynthesis